MIQPTSYAGVEFCKSDLAAFVGVRVAAKAWGEVNGVAAFQQRVKLVDDEAQQEDVATGWGDLALRFLQGESVARRAVDQSQVGNSASAE